MKKYTPIILGVLLGLAIHGAYRIGYKKGVSEAVGAIITQIDTVTRIDTLVREKPVYVAERVVDSIPYYIHVTDTISVLAYLPRTERTYKDSAYTAIVSGVDPVLQEIHVYQKTNTIHEVTYLPQKDTRKSFLELDARLIYEGMTLAPVTFNYGHSFGRIDVYAGSGYDFLQHSPVAQIGGRIKFKF